MIGTLYALAEATEKTSEASPDDPWATVLAAFLTFLTGVLPALGIPALVGVYLGSVLGQRRDIAKSKAERLAKHHEEVLTATVAILDVAQRANRGAQIWPGHKRVMSQYLEATKMDPNAKRHYEASEGYLEWGAKEIDASLKDAQPHWLKLKVLAPSLNDDVGRLLAAAADTKPTTEVDEDARRTEYLAATEAFTAHAQQYLGVE